LPTKLSDLYEQGINLLLKEWDQKRGVKRELGTEAYRKLSVGEKKKLLSFLAVRKFEQEQYVLFEQGELQGYIAEYLRISTEDSEAVLDSIAAQHGLLIKPAQGFWSFSHLTFQEYFAAKWFCDRHDWDGLAEYVRYKHWREVFLLSLGIAKSADKLLCLMKQKIDSIIADEQLQQFLRWVSAKSLSVNVSYNPAAIRAFYLSLALDIHYQIAAGDNGIVPISPQLVRVLDYNFFSIIEPDLALDVTLKLALATDQEVNNNGLAKFFLSSASALYYAFYHDFNPEIEEPIQQLQAQLPHPSEDYDSFMEWWKKNGKSWTKQLRLLMIQHRDIGHDWQQFKKQQKELLSQYYDANKLLVDCLNSGFAVSVVVKKEIEETLLLPIEEIKKRQ